MKKNIFISILIIISFHFSYGQVNKQDSLALVALYNSTDGPNWKTNNNWLSKKRVPYWSGISVISNRVTSIKLNANNLTGSIPSEIGNLTKLTSLNLYLNNLTGTIPPEIGNLTELTVLLLYNNNLSGTIPSEIGNLTALTSLQLYKNTLTGSIPSEIGNITKLKKLHLSENNLSGAIPSGIGNLTDLETIYLSYNNLTGIIPSEIGNLTKLQVLFLGENNLIDPVPTEIGNITTLYSLGLANNNFEGPIPPEIVNSPVLKNIYISYNFLDYSDLEPLAAKNISNSWYAPQLNDTSELHYEVLENSIKFTMDSVGGTRTFYQWFKKEEGEDKYLGSTETNSFTIGKDENIQSYYCRTINQVVDDLHFVGLAPQGTIEEKDCWQTGQLTFCLNSGKWEKAGKDKIKTSNIISINDFLYFKGTMTIDTANIELDANGEFYVDNIPLAKDLGIGKYTLGTGKYNLKLLGDEEKITNFLNSELSKTAMIFGTPLKIDDLQFFSREDTVGIKLNASVSIPLLSAGCGNPALYETNTDLALKDFEITNKGILSVGFQVENLGFLSQGCLKNANLSYDWKKDVLIGGAEVSVSYFGDVGVGVKIEDGKLDSVAWKIDSNLKPIPVYATLGVKGFYGHFAGLNNVDKFNQHNLKKLDIKVGGIFTDFITDNFYLAEVDGRIRMDGLLETNGSVQLMQPPGDVLPYQISGTGGMKLDYASKQLGFDFTGKFGTITGDSWLGDAWGGFNVNYRDDVPKASSHFSADISLLELPDKYPLNYLKSIISSIGTVGTRNVICEDDPTHVYGLMYHKSDGFNLFSFNYKIDITKNWYQSGYIQFPEEKRIYITIEEKSGVLADDISKIFTVPENNDFGIVEIKSQNSIPVSSITSPNGKKYSSTSQEDKILYTESAEKNQSFWSVFNAAPGDWTITLSNPAKDDSVITHFHQKDQDFKFTVNQTGNTVIVNWDVAQVKKGQIINLLLDDDNVNFDGFKITEGDALLGSLSFTLDESTPNCNYYLFVQLIDEYSVVESYAEIIIENPLASLAPPTNFNSTYSPETGEVEFTWDASPLPDITGYILSVTDELGNDSVYAILNSNQTEIALFIEDFKSKSAKIESYNFDWKIGCPNILDLQTTSNETDFRITEPNDKLKVYPNPTTGQLNINYFVSEDSKCEIRIFDIQGRQIAQPLSEYRTAGFYQLEFQYKSLPNGLYIIKYVNNNHVFTSKSILNN